MPLDFETLGEEYEKFVSQRQKQKLPLTTFVRKNHAREDFQKELQIKAENAIRKHIKSKFGKLPENERKEKTGTYLEWVGQSLKQKYPLFDEEDLTKSEGEGWVSVVHNPTLFEVRHSGEETMHLNERNAEINLYNLLDNHINYWKDISNSFKKDLGLKE